MQIDRKYCVLTFKGTVREFREWLRTLRGANHKYERNTNGNCNCNP